MYKYDSPYTDFNGVERKEDFYFNLTEAEILQMEFGTSGGLADQLLAIMRKKDGVVIMKTFSELIDASYGVKSPDGRTFEKTPEALRDFKSTKAYSDLYKKLVTDSDYAIEFVNSIIPGEVSKEEIDKLKSELGLNDTLPVNA